MELVKLIKMTTTPTSGCQVVTGMMLLCWRAVFVNFGDDEDDNDHHADSTSTIRFPLSGLALVTKLHVGKAVALARLRSPCVFLHI